MSENYILDSSPKLTEAINTVPKWIFRWGITIIFILIISLFIFSSIISYPDLVKANIKISSKNSPKSIITHHSGKLTSLFANNGDIVYENQILGFIESTGNPTDILELSKTLNQLKTALESNNLSKLPTIPKSLNLGEIQESYQFFFKDYLDFESTLNFGYYAKKIGYAEKDLANLKALNLRLEGQKRLQIMELKNNETELNAYKKLYQKKVISRSEYMLQENRFLSSKYPSEQTEILILNNKSVYNDKIKELAELTHTMSELKQKFQQSLNQCISQINNWIKTYVLKAPTSGTLTYAGLIEKNQNLSENQEVFIIKTKDSEFFGEIYIPQYNMGKVEVGQKVIVKLYSYPFEQYGIIRGKLIYISDVAFHDSLFIAKVRFEKEKPKRNRKITLKNGMKGDAEIITNNSSILQRLVNSLNKIKDSE